VVYGRPLEPRETADNEDAVALAKQRCTTSHGVSATYSDAEFAIMATRAEFYGNNGLAGMSGTSGVYSITENGLKKVI